MSKKCRMFAPLLILKDKICQKLDQDYQVKEK